ncbi:hypothetical protein KQJ29_31940, partial [Enterococcus sp. S181_ASV_20]|nr:hypothetical protein [Enterococcus sp. S181_ASV_20]
PRSTQPTSSAASDVYKRQLHTYSIPVYRKSNELLEETLLEEWKEKGIAEWIEIEPSIEVLREVLSSYMVKQGKVIFLPPVSYTHLTLPTKLAV